MAHYLTLILLFFLSSLHAQTLQRQSFEAAHMGTSFKIIVYCEVPSIGEAAANKAFERIAQLDQIMSDYNPNSELSQLSATSGSGKKIKVSKDLYRILKYSKRWSNITDGHFDISIGPLSKLWRKAFRQQEFPDSIAIQNALAKVNYRWIKLYSFGKKVKLQRSGMRLDLGGIAKGYALDEAMKTLKKSGIKIALIDGGGDILCLGNPPDKNAWDILPVYRVWLQVKNGAVATSGDTYRYLEWKGTRYSHIINPKTGYGIQDQKIVTTQAKTGIEADLLASTLSIISKKQFKKWKKSWIY